MKVDNNLKLLLKQAWHEEAAKNSIERWLAICESEHWEYKPDNLEILVRIFGASWYFTRFVFVHGEKAIDIIDENTFPDFSKDYFEEIMAPTLTGDDLEENIDQLRLLKNSCMLQILIGILNQSLALDEAEKALTELAVVTLSKLIEILQRHYQISNFPVTILGMGRMAGNEMTFGSDLDLIFLYETEDQEIYANIGRMIRLLLRTISQPAPLGVLYDVDMRLRPHGNSGPLVTAYNTFIEYHSMDHEIWERQLMTRCRPVLVMSEDVETIMHKVRACIYTKYDTGDLCKQIISMRHRVQAELGSPKDKFDIKRGEGGIMDIDFIAHYFQLSYGYKHHSLQTGSTRTAISELGRLGLVSEANTSQLMSAYNYLKRVEMCLRLFDLKSIDTFSSIADDNIALSKAMGHGDAVDEFQEQYMSVITEVRKTYTELMV
jgi:[glutamine synthetase] adenylyltransferase / [glutamine synthetase]-adenylyl-L-tyrosine phosphorylase